MASLIHSTVPVLPSPDLAVSEAFYVQKLGFRAALSMPGTYLIVERRYLAEARVADLDAAGA